MNNRSELKLRGPLFFALLLVSLAMGLGAFSLPGASAQQQAAGRVLTHVPTKKHRPTPTKTRKPTRMATRTPTRTRRPTISPTVTITLTITQTPTLEFTLSPTNTPTGAITAT